MAEKGVITDSYVYIFYSRQLILPLFSSPDKVQESLCCHPVVGVGVGVGFGVGVCVSINKLIDYSSHTHLLTPLKFGTHMPWDKTFPCMSKC